MNSLHEEIHIDTAFICYVLRLIECTQHADKKKRVFDRLYILRIIGKGVEIMWLVANRLILFSCQVHI